MTGRQLAALAVRVLAIYCVVLALTYSQQLLFALTYYWGILEPPRPALEPPFGAYFTGSSLTIAVTPFVFYIVATVLLWKFAPSIARHIAPDEGENYTALDSYAIHVITFSAIGVIIIARALPDFTILILDALASRDGNYFYIPPSFERGNYLISIVQILFGLSLICGRERIVQGIHTIRDIKNLGRDPSFPSDNPPTAQP